MLLDLAVIMPCSPFLLLLLPERVVLGVGRADFVVKDTVIASFRSLTAKASLGFVCVIIASWTAIFTMLGPMNGRVELAIANMSHVCHSLLKIS